MILRTTLSLIITVTVAGMLGACGDAPRGSESATDVAEPTQQATVAELPDTTGADVWEYLQEVNYENAWAFWPDKEPLYPGTEPHGALLNTYLNEPAAEAVSGGGANFADGSILVKENYMPDSSLAGVTVMFKAADYNPQHNNWFWAKYGPNGDIQAEGRVESCQSCHNAEPDGNYIMTGDL